jgi:hypothetical protein
MLVKVGLDDLGGKLLPVGSLQNELLAALDVLVLDGSASLDGVLSKTFLGEIVGVLNNKLACFQKVIKRHRAVLLVLWLTQGVTFCEHCLNGFLGWGSLFEGLLLLRLLLGDDDFLEALKFFVFKKVEVLSGANEMR